MTALIQEFAAPAEIDVACLPSTHMVVATKAAVCAIVNTAVLPFPAAIAGKDAYLRSGGMTSDESDYSRLNYRSGAARSGTAGLAALLLGSSLLLAVYVTRPGEVVPAVPECAAPDR